MSKESKEKDDELPLPGCSHETLKPHSCPYGEDIHGDYDTLCTCCEYCQGECANDI